MARPAIAEYHDETPAPDPMFGQCSGGEEAACRHRCQDEPDRMDALQNTIEMLVQLLRRYFPCGLILRGVLPSHDRATHEPKCDQQHQ
jgi:hypothetical protein